MRAGVFAQRCRLTKALVSAGGDENLAVSGDLGTQGGRAGGGEDNVGSARRGEGAGGQHGGDEER